MTYYVVSALNKSYILLLCCRGILYFVAVCDFGLFVEIV